MNDNKLDEHTKEQAEELSGLFLYIGIFVLFTTCMYILLG